MRTSADQKSPHYNPWSIHFTVYLNGVVVTSCIEADSGCGWVKCYRYYKNTGRLLTRDGEALTEIRHGSVCIYIPPEYEDYAKNYKP